MLRQQCRGKTKRGVLSAQYSKNVIDPVHVTVWCEGVSSSSGWFIVCLYVSVVHKNMPYDGVQVYTGIRNNAQVYKAV